MTTGTLIAQPAPRRHPPLRLGTGPNPRNLSRCDTICALNDSTAEREPSR